MQRFSEEQTARFLEHIGLPATKPELPDVDYLAKVQKHTLLTVPFESITLHYSKERRISLDINEMYENTVHRNMGGYCMENNAIFAALLRSLGYTLISVAARVSKSVQGIFDGTFLGLNHMVNIVTIGDQRYLVDVGFGGDNPTVPIPLIDGHIVRGRGNYSLRVQYKNLIQHSDPSQRAWVYSYREDDESEWRDGYSFLEFECFPEDYEIFNFNTSTNPQSFFVQSLTCMRFIAGEDGEIAGTLSLLQNEVRERRGKDLKTLQSLRTEKERVAALKKWFRIELSEEEIAGIVGTPSEIKDITS